MPLVFWRKGLTPNSPDRKFPPLKTHLFAQYSEILQSNPLLLFVSLQDVPSATLRKIRKDLENTTKPKAASNPLGVPKGVHSDSRSPPRLIMVRKHMFLAAMRGDETVKNVRRRTVSLLEGHIGVLSMPSVDPEHLSSILKVLERALPKPKPGTAAAANTSSKPKADAMFVMPPPGGGGMQKEKAPTIPSMSIVGGLVEGRLFMLDGLRDVTKLPNLRTLHAQIVGLLTSPASQLSGVLSQAAGGRLVRTLDGLKQTLESAENQGG